MKRRQPPIIPVSQPLLTPQDIQSVVKCLRAGWISSEGPVVRRFEREFSRYHGMKYGAAVANGTAALELAVRALKLPPRSEIIVPTFTIISCVLAILRAGQTPVLVDCDSKTWNASPENIQQKLTPRTRAIMCVHIYGLPLEMDAIMRIAKRNGLLVIEDNAELIGQTYKGRRVGSFGDVSCFSFYANKHVTCGEGGMVLTNRKIVYEKVCSLRNLGFIKRKRFYHFDEAWNFRLTSLQAALGLSQFKNLKKHLAKKRKIGAFYTRALQDLPDLVLPPAATRYARNIYWVYGIVLGKSYRLDARRLAFLLREKGVETRPFFWPMHLQPVFRARGLFLKERHPVSEKLARRGLYLPCGAGTKPEELKRVVKNLKIILKKHL